MKRIAWSYVLLYYAVAMAISAPFNTGIIYKWFHWPHVPLSWQPWLFLPAALGPLVAASLCYRFDRTISRRIDWLGQDALGSVLTALVPLTAFPLIAYATGGVSGLISTLVAASISLLYSLGEEVGWRGYLQEALTPVNTGIRSLVIGVLWWVWHCRFANSFEWTVFPLLVILSAFVLGHAVQKTRSLLVVASMHSVMMLLTMQGALGSSLAIAGAVVLCGWVLIGRLRPLRA